MMEAALYATVWGALICFVAGEAAKPLRHSGGPDRGWPWLVWTAGAALLAAHIAIALDVRHGWSHASVARAVAEQSRRVFGVGWGGGMWMNYLFAACWIGEAFWWAAAPRDYLNRPWLLRVAMRALYALILVNAAVVFAAASRRWAGVVLIAVLAWAWRDTFSARFAGSAVPARVKL